MTDFPKLLAGVLFATVATPIAAQYNPYPNQPGYNYPAYPGQGYPQNYPGYGYSQGYTGNPVTDIIDQLLGNRYSMTDRQAVRTCARAATAQAQSQYGGYGREYRRGYGYNQGIAAPNLRVTSITDVERRWNGLRIRGTLGTGYGGQYGNGYRYPGQGYRGEGYGDSAGDLSFRCTLDNRGQVTDVRLSPNGAYRRY